MRIISEEAKDLLLAIFDNAGEYDATFEDAYQKANNVSGAEMRYRVAELVENGLLEEPIPKMELPHY